MKRVQVQHDNKTNRLMTPNEVADRLRVTGEKVRQLIRAGHLEAMNIGTGQKRPLYRIHPNDLEAFLNSSRQHNSHRRNKTFRRLPHGPDFFPDLR